MTEDDNPNYPIKMWEEMSKRGIECYQGQWTASPIYQDDYTEKCIFCGHIDRRNYFVEIHKTNCGDVLTKDGRIAYEMMGREERRTLPPGVHYYCKRKGNCQKRERENKDNMARFKNFDDNTMQVKWGDMVLSGSVLDMQIDTHNPVWRCDSWGGTGDYLQGNPETTITATIRGEMTEGLVEAIISPKNNWFSYQVQEDIRKHFDGGDDGKFTIYHVGPNGEYSITVEKISDEEVAMKAVYKVYAVNRETGVVWQGSEPFNGDKRRDVALQAAILDNATDIRSLGASELVHVWLEPVGDYEEI